MKLLRYIILCCCVYFSSFNLAIAEGKVRLYYIFYAGIYTNSMINNTPLKVSAKFLDWHDQSKSIVLISKRSNFFITKSILISQEEWGRQNLPTKAQIEIEGQNLKSPILDISLKGCHKWHNKTDANLLINEVANSSAPDQVILCSVRYWFED